MLKRPNPYNKKKNIFTVENREEWFNIISGRKYRTATVHETLGPNWKDYYEVGATKRPMVILKEGR